MPARKEPTETAVEKRLEEVKEQEGLDPEVVRAQEAVVRESFGEETVVGRSRRATADDNDTQFEYDDLLGAGRSYEVDGVRSSQEEVAGALKLAGVRKASRSEMISAIRAFRDHPVTD
jgi:hypothetical protein